MGLEQRVLVDADVLFSRTLRDWVLMLSSAVDARSPFVVCWTEDILAEAVARLRDHRPDLPSGVLETISDRLHEIWCSSQIRGFDAQGESFVGRDEGDLHVHSAAVHGRVDLVVTGDRAGLRPGNGCQDSLDLLLYEILTPDEFLVLVDQQAGAVVRDCAREQLKHFTACRTAVDLPGSLVKAGAPCFAQRVRRHLTALAVQGY